MMRLQNHQGAYVSRGKKNLKNYCLGVVLRRLLCEHRLTLTQLSLAANKPVSTLHDWLYGNVPANPEDVRDVAAFFKLTRDDLEFGNSTDRAQQLEIANLKEEKEALERKLEMNQLDMFSYQEAIERKNAELKEYRETAI